MAQPLILTRASVSRSSRQWRDDDYDVLEDGEVVGRIFFLDAVGPAPGCGHQVTTATYAERHTDMSRRARL